MCIDEESDFTSSEFNLLENMLKNPAEDFQKLLSLMRKKDERQIEKFKETERRFRSLIEQTTDAVFCYEFSSPIPIDLSIDEQVTLMYDCILIDCNLVCAQTYGADRVEDVLGRKLIDLFGTTPSSLNRLFMNMIESGYQIVDGVGIEKIPGEEDRYYLNNGHGVIENGKLLRIWGTFRDITESKKAELKLKESERKYHSLFDISPVGIGIGTQDGRTIAINDRLRKITGYLTEDVSDIYIKDTYASVDKRVELFNTLEEDGEVKGFEAILKRKDGSLYDALINVVFIDIEGEQCSLAIIEDITDRKKVEKKIKESEEKWRSITENSPDFILTLDKEKNVQFINRSELTSMSRDDVIGKSIYNFVPDPNKESAKECFNRVLETGQNDKYFSNFIYDDGTIHNFETRVGPLLKREEIIGFTVSSTDITDRKIAEQKLRESEKKLRGIMTSITDQIIILDRNLTILYLNKVVEEIYGPSALGSKCYQLYHGLKEPCSDCQVRRTFEDGEVHHKECLREVRGESGYCWCVSSVYETDKEDRPISVIEVSRDITERKKSGQKLRESEEKYRGLINNLLDVIIECNLEGEFLTVSHQCFDILGFKPEEMIGKRNIDFIHPDDVPKIISLMKNNTSIGDQAHIEHRCIHKEGHYVTIFVTGQVVEIDGKKKFIGVMRDITKRKEVERKLKELSNLKSELLTRTSHELKTPAMHIKGYTDLLLHKYKKNLGIDELQIINNIEKGVLRLQTLIYDILHKAELDSAQGELKKVQNDLASLIDLSVRELRSFAALRGHSIILDIHENLIISFDKDQIRHVINNLITNAIKYTPLNGIIRINTTITDDFITIAIQDNGIGLNEEQINRLFTQFGKIERYGQGFDIITDGSGLGLLIAKKIIDLHGGKIWVESEGRNKGSRFYFSLPRNNN